MKTSIILSSEQEVCGKWTFQQGTVIADDNCRRIELLITEHLKKVGSDASGWDQLYIDPDDERYWELTYPDSEQHGGGAPRLKCITENEARAKYNGIVNTNPTMNC